jgi:hypothetical protein
MRLTPEEIQFFRNLSSSEAGAILTRYFKRLQSHISDIRTFNEKDTIESAKRASDILQEFVIDKLSGARNEPKEDVGDEGFE